jgi:Ca2+-binding RTX toxin-like protein
MVAAWSGSTVAVAAFVALSAMLPATALAADDPAPTCMHADQLGLVLIIDDSGSMMTTDPDELRTEASAVALAQQSNGGVFALSAFSTMTHEIVPPTELTSANRDGIEATIRSRFIDFNTTDYQAAFLEAQRQLDAMPPSVDKKAVLFMSDGVPDGPFTSDGPIAAAHIPIYTIGFAGADQSGLAGIAARSGGQTFPVGSVGDLQPVAAKILAVLECNAQNIVQNVALAPGQTKHIPFTVAPTEDEFKALAAWNDGDVTATLTRPDGSTMDASHVLSNERWDSGATFASGVGTDPLRGGWIFNLTASAANLSTLDVTINVWGGDPATEPEPDPDPDPVVPDPVIPDPPADTPPVQVLPTPVLTHPAAPSCSAVVLEVGRQPDVLVSWGAAPAVLPALAGYVVETRPHGSNGQWKPQPFTSLLELTITSAPGNSLDISVRAQYADGTLSEPCLVEAITVPKVRNLLGTSGSDKLVGSDGDDIFRGLAGNDLFSGGDGNDKITGGAGKDKLSGQRGKDVVNGGPGKDKLDGGAGNDKIIGGADSDTLLGGSGNDTIDARDRSADTIRCGSGKDKVLANKKDKVAFDCELVVRSK